MKSFWVVKDGQFFYTQGLEKVCEKNLFLVLDEQTAKDRGEKTAEEVFTAVLAALNGEIIEEDRLYALCHPRFDANSATSGAVGVSDHSDACDDLVFGCGAALGKTNGGRTESRDGRNAIIKAVSYLGCDFFQVILADSHALFPWQKGCDRNCLCQLYGQFSLDNIYPILDEVFPTGTISFSEYVKWTSECHGNFYRTCHKKMDEPAKERYDGWNTATHLVIAFAGTKDYDPLLVSFRPQNENEALLETGLKMQLCPTTKENVVEEAKWNIMMNYQKYRIIDLINRKDVTSNFPFEPPEFLG